MYVSHKVSGQIKSFSDVMSEELHLRTTYLLPYYTQIKNIILFIIQSL